MKQAFRLSCAAIMFVLVCGVLTFAQAQNPDPFVTQVSSSLRNSYAGGMNGNGRFVVIESNGDISTEKIPSMNPDGTPNPNARNNEDGNREIFLFDFAQRRIFQITDTKSALRAATACPTPSPTPTPSPSPTPTPTPTPTPVPDCAVDVEISNNQPVLSNNGRWIVFTSNALTPANFDGNVAANHTALSADGNQEIFIYFIPAVADADLTSGADVPFVNLAAGTFTQLTNTPASRTPTPGTATVSPFVAFDNRDPAVNDNASVVGFVSTRNIGGGNADFNPEIFLYNRTANTTVQMTNTQTTSATNPIFNSNPSLSGQNLPGTVGVSFFSNANISIGGSSNNADNNGELYIGTFDGTTASVTRQASRTTTPVTGFAVNIVNAGRRMSRDGNLVALESYSAEPKTNGTTQSNPAIFVYNITTDAFTQVGPRATSGSDVQRFPTFTGDGVNTSNILIFSSALNFRADGTVPTTAADGLNPNNMVQVFSTPVPPATLSFSRLTNTVNANSFRLQPFPSNTRDRIAFSMEATELGGGNADNSAEAFYLRPRTGTDVTTPTVSFFTGASQRPIATPSPTPPAVNGLAPGMIGIVRSTSALANTSQDATGASEATRRPPLPVELSGVTVSINYASAGLLSIRPNEIRFVVPVGLAATTGTNTYPVVINNNGSIIRSTIQINPTQPDIFTTTNDAGGRAIVLNVTNPALPTPEPFTVTSTNGTGATVPTILQVMVTGVRNVVRSQVTVRIGTTDITGEANILLVGRTDMPGVEQINVVLPASLAGAGDVPVIVSVTVSGVTYTSRPADTAPHIQIN